MQMIEHVSHFHLNNGEYKDAAGYIALLLKRVPQNNKLPSLLANLAKGYQQTKNPQEAAKCLRILATKYASSPEGMEAARILAGMKN